MLKLIVNNLSQKSELNIIQQQVRSIRQRKPPWVPRAKSKMFFVPEYKEPDLEEKKFITPLTRNYNAHMRSLYQLFKTEYKFSSSESNIFKEAKRAQQLKEEKLLKENEEYNKKILQLQLVDEDSKLEEKKKQIIVDYHKKLEREAELARVADEKVRVLKEKVKSFIDPSNLVYEIEKSLNSVVDYNFAITKSGRKIKASDKIEEDELEQSQDQEKIAEINNDVASTSPKNPENTPSSTSSS